VGLQRLENKVLSWGIIGKSAPILAEITIRKSQVLKPDNVYYGECCITGGSYHLLAFWGARFRGTRRAEMEQVSKSKWLSRILGLTDSCGNLLICNGDFDSVG